MDSSITLTSAQEAKAREKLLKNMLDARESFVSANPDYEDIAVDLNDARVLKGLPKDKDGNPVEAEIAAVRKDFIIAGRSTATLDILSVKSEKDTSEEGKFKMIPFLGAKRYRYDGSVWKRGFQSPVLGKEPYNKFVTDGTGMNSMMLRSKGLFQLMSEDEIKDFVASFPLDFNLYFQLFF